MDDSLIPKLYRHIRRQIGRRGSTYDPCKIIDKAISRTSDTIDKSELISFKISIIVEFCDKSNLKYEIVRLISTDPLFPNNWLILLYYYRDELKDREKSLAVCDIAIYISKLTKEFMIQCMTEKLRTALFFDDIPLSIECLEYLTTFESKKGSLDEAFQTNFLNHPNVMKIPQLTLQKYLERVYKYGKK